jgi:hypothetical protein
MEWAAPLGCSVFGVVVGLGCAWVISVCLGQMVVDAADDNVFHWALPHFPWLAATIFLACCTAGAAAGFLHGRAFARADDLPEQPSPGPRRVVQATSPAEDDGHFRVSSDALSAKCSRPRW